MRNILRPWLCRFEPNLRIGLGRFLWGELLCADANWPDRFGSARLRFTRFIGSTGSTGSRGSSVPPVPPVHSVHRFVRFFGSSCSSGSSGSGSCGSSVHPQSRILDAGSWIQDPGSGSRILDQDHLECHTFRAKSMKKCDAPSVFADLM